MSGMNQPTGSSGSFFSPTSYLSFLSSLRLLVLRYIIFIFLPSFLSISHLSLSLLYLSRYILMGRLQEVNPEPSTPCNWRVRTFSFLYFAPVIYLPPMACFPWSISFSLLAFEEWEYQRMLFDFSLAKT